ncbi:hypothetical protein [Lewinella sp. LCG006]|uniref:hypothetical protein n=1 Tax=Lewinella sp. LCG006 TaxID=3231911 RepID=UPI00345F3EFA
MRYATQKIWPGVYSSHQRCTQAVGRLNLTLDDQQRLSKEDYVKLLQYRLKTAKGETRTCVLNKLQTLGAVPIKATPTKTRETGDLPVAEGFPAPAVDDKPALIQAIESLARWTTSRAAIFLTLLGALSIQIHHLASLVHRVSENDGLLLGYIFATVSELTALMLTVHQARKGMLIIFAVVQCWINILYYCTLPDLVIRLTLSALIAFVIYSYSELFTTLQRDSSTASLFTSSR